MARTSEASSSSRTIRCPCASISVPSRGKVETRIYPDAHHSFDALGLPVRYLAGAGNRSKPGGCCGAHYGANEAAWKAFVADTKAFLARHLAP